MNSLICFTFLLVIGTVFSDPLLNLDVDLTLGGQGGGIGGGQAGGRPLSGGGDGSVGGQTKWSGGSVGETKSVNGGAPDKMNNSGKEQTDGGKDEMDDNDDRQGGMTGGATDKMDNSSKEKTDGGNDEMDDNDDGQGGMTELQTPNKLEYRFFAVADGEVRFEVRAPNDAHLAFTTKPTDSNPMYEIIIGGWKNTKSVIRKNKTKPEKAEKKTNKILKGDEFLGFWVRWDSDSGSISVGRENEDSPFLSWVDPEPVEINYMGVSTGYGAKGTWRLNGGATDKMDNSSKEKTDGGNDEMDDNDDGLAGMAALAAMDQ